MLVSRDFLSDFSKWPVTTKYWRRHFVFSIVQFTLKIILVFFWATFYFLMCVHCAHMGRKASRQSRKDSIARHIFFREGVGVPPNNPVRVKQKHEKNEEEHSIIGGDSFFQIYLINHPN